MLELEFFDCSGPGVHLDPIVPCKFVKKNVEKLGRGRGEKKRGEAIFFLLFVLM